MADLNSLIAQGVQFRAPPDPFAQYAQMQQLQQGEQANQMNQMKMQEYQRGVQEQNALRGAMSRPGFDLSTPESQRQAYIAAPTLAEGLIKGHLSNVKTAAEITEALGRVAAQPVALAKAKIEAVDAAQKQSRDRLNRIDPYSPDAGQQLFAWHQSNHAPGILGDTLRANGSTTEQSQQEIANVVNKGPQAIADFIARSSAGQQEFAKMIAPIPKRVTNGQMSFVVDENPRSPTFGQKIGGAGVKMEMTPAEIASNAIAQKRLTQEGQGVTYQTDANGNIVAMQSRLAPGETPTARSVVAPGGGMQPLKAKPTALAEKTAVQRKQLNLDLDRAITELTNATKAGGLIDQSTGSGAGRLIDLAAGFGGQATKGAIAIGELQPISDIALKMVPRFEGPQSNADTTSYKQAAGQLADPTLPREIRKKAGLTVLRLMKERKNQFASLEMATEGVTPSPTGSIHDQADAILRGK
jgi:hypothetical protein